MTKYVAMLRGIGPGNPNMTKEKFKAFFESLGFTSIQVVLASGNIVFEDFSGDANALAVRIEAALPKVLGFQRSVIIRSQANLRSIIEADPFAGIEQAHNKAKYLLITFFRQPPAVSPQLPYTPENKPYTLLGSFDGCVFGVVDISLGKTPDYMAWLEKQFGKDITSRTPQTIRRILAVMDKAER